MFLKSCALLLLSVGFVCCVRNPWLKAETYDNNNLGVAARYSGLARVAKHRSPDARKVFYIRYNPVTFWEAIQHCIDEGKRLASVESEKDTEELMEMIGHKSKDKFWIAGTNIGLDNKWIWLNKGDTIRYTRFLPGQPDNWNGMEHCLEFDADTNGHWNDYDCDECNQYICEDIKSNKG